MLGRGGYGQGGSSALGGEICHDILTIAARARPHRPEGCQSPSIAICQVPGLAGCGYWLSALICLGQTRGIGDAKPLPKHCLRLLGERLDCAVCGRSGASIPSVLEYDRVRRSRTLGSSLDFPPFLPR